MTGTDANGCTIALADTVNLIIGIEETTGGYSLNLYPNPTQNQVTVDINLPSPQNVQIDIYTAEGQLVKSMEQKEVTTAKFNVSFAEEAQGIYVAKIKVGNSVTTHRIVIAK